MPTRSLLLLLALGSFALPFARMAQAQTTTGAIRGTVTDATTGALMLLVTVVASSPSLQGQASELTDAGGQYYLSNLPPGTYSLLFVYGHARVRRDSVEVSVGKVTAANARLYPQAAEVVTIEERATAIDVASTKQGTTVTQDYLKNVPNRGRTYDGVLGAAGGARRDRYGTSFSGSSSIENSYIVDGINTTGVKFGDVQSPVLNNFIQEIEIITGGYNAEFGRFTGGVVNVVTKSGSNDFHGSMWASTTPFEVRRDPIQSAASAFRHDAKPDADLDFGFDIGGPLIKDRLWFYVGFAPFIRRTTNTRIVSTQVDRRVNGVDYRNESCPERNEDGSCDGDRDPRTTSSPGCELIGNCESDDQADLDAADNPIFEEIERQRFTSTAVTYQVTGKLNFALSPDHQGQASFVGAPGAFHRMLPGAGSGGNPPCVAGTPTFCQLRITVLTADAAFKWTSKLNDSKTQIDAVLGWHRWTQKVAGLTEDLPNEPGHRAVNEPRVRIENGDVNGTAIGIARNWDTNESDAVAQFCKDEAPGSVTVDQFPRIRNCPFDQYFLGGVGNIDSELEKRMTGKLVLTQRVKLLGHHQLKLGGDVEVNQISDRRRISGGGYYGYVFYRGERSWISNEWAREDESGPDVCGFRDDDSPIRCLLLRDGLQVDAKTVSWAAFVQDSWSILPNLTINAGLRYEEQRLGYADQVQGTIDPVTGRPVGDTALKLSGMFAPRIGIVYDWTQEGRSKVYANWGRFYESMPMDINERAFGGESLLQQFRDPRKCLPFAPGPNSPNLPSDPRTCPRVGMDGSNRPVDIYPIGFGDPAAGFPPGLGVVVPGIKPQSLDEVVIGAEYELLADLRVGLSYQNRRMRTVIEDVSPDGGVSFYLANPGTFPRGEEEALKERILREPVGDLRNVLIKRLEDFRRIRNSDKPVREYNAVQLTVSKRFSRNFMVQGSYIWSQLRGNYPGLFQPESGQLDPHLASQFDLPFLDANRFGLLPDDRTHQIKLDGYYTFDLEKAGRITAGLRVRAASGRPIEAIGESLYPQTWLLPAGTSGRTQFGATADLHVAYSHRIGQVEVELYCELFNLLNSQFQTEVDNQYTYDKVHPIVGGDASDLAWAKTTFGTPVTRNLNWRNTTARQDPLTGRLGATVSF